MSDDDRYRRFNLRIPKSVFARLQIEADARSHSMNAEIIQRLEGSLKSGTILTDAIEDLDREMTPQNEDERAIIKILRGLTKKEKAILHGLLQGFVDARKEE